MKLEDLPEGTVVVLGHPDNGVSCTRQHNGQWLYNDYSHRAASVDDLAKAGRVVYIPGSRDVAEKPEQMGEEIWCVNTFGNFCWLSQPWLNGQLISEEIAREIAAENPDLIYFYCKGLT
jgi:hypothetical protein